MRSIEVQRPPDYSRIAWQSALAASLSLGLPAGLLFWLILLQQLNGSAYVAQSVAFLQANGLNKVFVLTVSSLLWSFLLGRISGYRAWWWMGVATMLGILAGWLSPLSNLDGLLHAPVHVVHAVSISGIVGSFTVCVGLAYGFLLRSGKAALIMALTTALASAMAILLTVVLFDQFGIRVGTGNLAMSKVTAACMMTSAIAGGATLGVLFSRFVWEGKSPCV